MSKSLMFWDLETQPDFARLPTFGLPELPPYAETPAAELPDAWTFLAGTLDEMKAATFKPSAEWCANARKLEAAAKKPRVGAYQAIDRLADMQSMYEREQSERIKLLSVTPEYCSIAAFGWALDDEEPKSFVVGADGRDERDLLDAFWSMAAKSVLVGYNICGFDLPVIFARSAILRVRPSIKIDTTPWKGAVLDLYLSRFPKGNFGGKGPGKLKELAALYGLVTQAEDVDGSHVYKLMQEKKFDEVSKYVESDVSLCQQMHGVFEGLFV